MGFDIKMDTNGSNPQLIKKLIDYSLVDYIALDFKSTKSKYHFITNSYLYDKFLKTLKDLIKKDFNFEVRTMIHEDLLNEEVYNRIKAVLTEKGRTNNWLADQLKMNRTTISKWCRNDMQPRFETLFQIKNMLDVDVREFLISTK